jgi:DNA (cytosine-5)-methyltransferase 1
MPIIYGSVCSGIEAATAAWHQLGMRAAWYAEIEPFPCAVLAHHYPNTPNLGDMTRLAAMVLSGIIVAPDILVGGTPCQAFSVAGMREGLSDPRGALTIKYVELADAVDHVRILRNEPESIIVWENVPGVLSDKGNAFGCFLGALAGENCELQPSGKRWQDVGCVYGPKRTIAWRILDAQYFGLAQRRRRVFVVASARPGFDPASVLLEREGLRRDSAPGRSPLKAVAALTSSGVGTCGADDNQAQAGHIIATYGGGRRGGPIDVAACLVAKGQKLDFEVESFVVHGTQDPCVSRDMAFALGRNSGQENAVYAMQAAVPTHTWQRVRRLTPIECERLQGFPDNYTLIPWRNKAAQDCPDGPRYRAIGNSKAVPVIRWIGLRISRALHSST